MLGPRHRLLSDRCRELDRTYPIESRLTDPEAAARKLVEIANAIKPAQDGRIYTELVNGAFLKAGGTPDRYRAGIERAIASGWLWLHESGTYVKFTAAGADIHLRCCFHVASVVCLPVLGDFVETGAESPGHTRWAGAAWPSPNRAFVMSCASSPAIDDTSTVGRAMATRAASVCGIGRAED
jgi:hypothetical protein